ncbi:hypothetical protein B0H14DRAFT_2607422 [Mycena olivaceomarginata]|nr:hypothetical protein B0H14DRAFT_2607422 [Mycena olivaceomarginata]
MVHRNPEKMYYYKSHDFSAPDEKSEFTDYFVDSTHRLQNKNRAATTVFCAADSERHMMPGTYLISAKITAPTLEGWILETIQKSANGFSSRCGKIGGGTTRTSTLLESQ